MHATSGSPDTAIISRDKTLATWENSPESIIRFSVLLKVRP
jgi:hypothetical protein